VHDYYNNNSNNNNSAQQWKKSSRPRVQASTAANAAAHLALARHERLQRPLGHRDDVSDVVRARDEVAIHRISVDGIAALHTHVASSSTDAQQADHREPRPQRGGTHQAGVANARASILNCTPLSVTLGRRRTLLKPQTRRGVDVRRERRTTGLCAHSRRVCGQR
jgi:hypothetical protein